MKVLHLTTYLKGGAGVAAQRIVAAERAGGLDAELKTGVDFGIDPLLLERNWKTLPHVVARRLERELELHQKTTNPVQKHSMGLRSLGFVDEINRSEVDLIHLHWINDGLLSIADIAKITKPLVWTLHDNWAFCGSEHCVNLLENDHRYRDGYTRRNRAASSGGLDVDRWIWLWKMHCWKNLRCIFTAPSQWMTRLFRESVIGRYRSCTTIPNCIPTDVFCPGDKGSARSRLGIEPKARVVAFGAMLANDLNKGLARVVQAIEKMALPQRSGLTLLIFGYGDVGAFEGLGCQIVCVGGITSPDRMADIYRAADVFVCPSIVESFSLTCAEALSCGTPAVAFDASGTTDVIDHLKTGYLVRSYDVADFAHGICQCLDHSVEMSAQCRQRVMDKFSYDPVAAAFNEVYRQVAGEKRTG